MISHPVESPFLRFQMQLMPSAADNADLFDSCCFLAVCVGTACARARCVPFGNALHTNGARLRFVCGSLWSFFFVFVLALVGLWLPPGCLRLLCRRFAAGLWLLVVRGREEEDDQIGAFLDAIENSNLEAADALIGGGGSLSDDGDLSDEEGAVMALLAESDGDVEV